MIAERSGACLASLRSFFSNDPRVLEWGIAPARPTPNAGLLRTWVDDKLHAGMEYMAARLNERMDPKTFHPWAESAIVFAFPYAQPLSASRSQDAYKVAAYARGKDYHDTARTIWKDAEAHLKSDPTLAGMRFYGFADTAPVFERDLASEAGIGWRGKNCCTLNRSHGSAFHLAGFFLDVPLPPTAPVEEFCGGCTRCIDQCPTDAFLGPGRLDANKCISYWTIEARGEVPEDLSRRFGGWIFGCDVCQEVCPWNHKHIRGATPEGRDGVPGEPEGTLPSFPDTGNAWAALLRKGGGFRSRYRRNSPLSRAGRRNLLRNLAMAARNLGDTSVLESLRASLAEETDPVVRREIERTVAALEARAGMP
ncbi:MAG: 4Fe-4S ferredoxin, iron-sulfur binding protein [Fibrobacteres bacterium]|nr:4Fe-4S ferredoxin, iron-sulfur binding protein [Fibrobacterota bacterium]